MKIVNDNKTSVNITQLVSVPTYTKEMTHDLF